jgi:hypothetical protein
MRHFKELFLGHEVTPSLLTRDGVRDTLPQSRPVIASVDLLLPFEKKGQRLLLMWI